MDHNLAESEMINSLDQFKIAASTFNQLAEEVQVHKADRPTNRTRKYLEKINPTARRLLRARRARWERNRRRRLGVAKGFKIPGFMGNNLFNPGKVRQPLKIASMRLRFR